MTVEEFIKQNLRQIKTYPLALQALWHDYQNDWHQSHSLIDTARDEDSAWVHAYLHRKEGDIGNARYWYRRSGKPESRLSLSEEREEIARVLIQEITNRSKL